MRRKAVAVVFLALWPAACVLDWDSLEPDGGVAFEAGVDAEPDVAEAGPDASADAEAEAEADAPSCAFTFSGTLATWDFTGQTGTETSVAASSMAPGLAASAISRSSGLTPQSGLNSINASGWPTGALDTTRYFTLTLTPPSACALDVTSLGIDTKASGTGPTAAAAATSADSFASKSPFTPTTVTTVSLSVSGATKAVEIRVYGYTAQSTQGTFRVENTLTVSGKLH